VKLEELNRSLEEKIRERTQQLSEERDKLQLANQTKSRFFSIISHDLRGPMGVFAGYTNLIKEHVRKGYGEENDPELYKYIASLENTSHQVGVLLDNLLTWALNEQGMMHYRPEKVVLHEAVKENATLMKPLARAKSIHFHFDMNEEVSAYIDRNSFLSILRNLTSNAIKFTPTGGRISFEVHREEESGHARVAVHDSGMGIPTDKLRGLFEVSEDKVRPGTLGEKGTGLGLNLVMEFVKGNNGTITVESMPAQGTSFFLQFP